MPNSTSSSSSTTIRNPDSLDGAGENGTTSEPASGSRATVAAMNRTTVVLAGTGSYLPTRVMTNAELERMVETSDEWITTRTGIKERRIAAEGEHTSDMASKAAQAALADAGLKAEDVDLLLVSTATPDMFFPSTGCVVQAQIGARRAVCMDISAACSGFLYALEIARQMIAGGTMKTAVVIGAEKLSAVTDWTDRNTCVLFGDGAAAAVLRRKEEGGEDAENPSRGLLASVMRSDGNYGHILGMPGGGTRCPVTKENFDLRLNTLKMNGKETFKQAVVAMAQASLEVIEQAGLSVDEIACFIPHQANIRIIDAIADRLKIRQDRFMVNLDRYGNTGAAAVGIALDEARRTHRIKPGDKILLVVFGSGLTWASSIIEL